MTVDAFISRLDHVRPTGRGWAARCPAHEDHTPSLSVAEGETGLLVHCFAGCPVDAVARSLGLRVADLFYQPGSRGRPWTRVRPPPPRPLTWRKQAARLEDHAVSLWCRATRVLQAAMGLNTNDWTDDDCAAAMRAVEAAYADLERADALEAAAFCVRQRGLTKEADERRR